MDKLVLSCYNLIEERLLEREEFAKKRWADVTIRDNFVFSKTMEQYCDLYRQLLELIFNVKIR